VSASRRLLTGGNPIVPLYYHSREIIIHRGDPDLPISADGDDSNPECFDMQQKSKIRKENLT
jgi:hypothetical protein